MLTFTLYHIYHQVISKKEEGDIAQLMRDSELAISDAHKFADKLSNDLSLLDGVSRNLSPQTVLLEALVEPTIKH